MTDTEKSEQPQTNGLENGLDEDERSKMRPADIDADVREMERRKRVEMIMSSKLFREELERIIELQLKDGNGPAGLLQQISDMMGIQSGKLHTAHMFRGSNCVTPINDIRGVESMGYEKGEKNLRCKLASVFRLMDLYGWSQGINNQITARLNQDEEHFLVNPHGMLFNEITASSLVKVDMQGNIVEPGTTNFSVNTQGFLLHSAIHASRPDVNCVIHIKTPSVLAVSSLKCGLLPICQEALVIGEVSQHPFVSGIFEPEEREKIIRNLGPHNKVLLLHNHGAVCCGATIEEAFYNVYNTVLACETQIKLMPVGVENLLLVSDETRKQVYDAAHRAPDVAGDKKKFRVGEMEFEALIRMLDNAGFRTGYIYRHPLVKGELPKPKNDVEVPPAVSSLGYLIEQEEMYKQGNWKKYIDGRNRLDRTKWLNSPNVYQKVEILETGTSDPKKITKWVDQNSEEWVAESSPTHSSTPVRIDSALQFVPKGTNPKEFKKLQQQIKENRRADKITSGPQSHILEGVSWEDAKKLQDANITQTGDQVILVGAASKGIIQRNYQHNALVYKTPYAKNPFDSMSDKEIEDYKQLVERKQRGDTDYEESQSESEAISSSRQDGLRHFKSPLLSPQSATSETEEESRDEPRVLRIETKTAPRPIQAEVVLSDAESDTTDARVERSHSARYPKAEKPESVTLMNSFRKSWSLKREKDKSKDVEFNESRNLHSSLILKECEQDRMDSLHCCVARVKQLTHKPVVVDVRARALRPLLKSASDPCNLSTLDDRDASEVDDRPEGVSKDPNTSLSCGNIVRMSDLQQRLTARKKLLHSAKMKFLGYHKSGSDKASDAKDRTPTSPMCALISEIRETISEIMSPERSTGFREPDDYFGSMRWIERPKFVARSCESDLKLNEKSEELKSKVSLSKSFSGLNPSDSLFRSSSNTLCNFKNELQVLKLNMNSDRSDTSNCNCAIHGGNVQESSLVPAPEPKFDGNQNKEKPTENVITEVVKFVNASDEEATYTITDDSLLQTYSFTESTETEWYYNKTIMTLENSQTVLEIKGVENKEENLEPPAVKYIDTGIDTDFTSEKENESKNDDLRGEDQKEELEAAEDLDGDAPVCESFLLNKSSETDSSNPKSGSGRTSNDVDTSFAFKTETENSDKSLEKSTGVDEKKKFFDEMVQKAKEPIEEESSDSVETNEVPQELQTEKQMEASHPKLSDIPESPEFTNVDTEDAPVTSSSKDTSPEAAGDTERRTEDEPSDTTKDPEADLVGEKEHLKPEHKRRKNVKSSTKITVKKELKDKHSKEPVVSEIRLTIKNSSANCQSEKYEVKIQDLTNTSEDLSRSVSSADSFVQNVDSYESFEIMDKSCDCEAQQSLEELQGEVTSTIEKLHTIEDYFEGEIKKHTNKTSEKTRSGADECTIEYNYREFEEVLNESRGEVGKIPEGLGSQLTEDIPQTEHTEFLISFPSGDISGEIEVCNDTEGGGVLTDLCDDENPSLEKGMESIAMTSAFVATLLSEAILDENICLNGCQKFVTEVTPLGPKNEMVEVMYNIEQLSDSAVAEVDREIAAEVLAEIIDGLKMDETVMLLETPGEEKSDIESRGSLDENGNRKPENYEGPPEEKSTSDETPSSDVEVSEHIVQDQHFQNCQHEAVFCITGAVNGENTETKAKEQETSGEEQIKERNSIEAQNVEQLKEEADVDEEVQNSQQQVSCFEEVSERNNSELGQEVDKSFVAAESDSQEINTGCLSVEDEQPSAENNIMKELQGCQQLSVENVKSEKRDDWQQSPEGDGYSNDCQQPSEVNPDDEERGDCQRPLEENVVTEKSDDWQRLPGVNDEPEDKNDCQQPSLADTQERDVCQQPAGENEESDTKPPVQDCQTSELTIRTPLQAITDEPHSVEAAHPEKLDSAPVDYILGCLLNSVTEQNKKNLTSVNDVINFIVTNEESPTDSLLEFEDMENLISVSTSVVADLIDSIESQMEQGDVESLLEGAPKDGDGVKGEKRKRKKGESMFKVTIATPLKKEIFINYSLDCSSTFNTSADFDQQSELCNSYIKTDDVNEDFENLSSDNQDFYSVSSSGKNSLNSSFCSTDGHVTAEQFCCVGCEENPLKSPRSLAIIQEVDEGDSSTSSEVAAPSNPE